MASLALMKTNGIPETEEEADGLRAYIPNEILCSIGKTRDIEIAQSKKLSLQCDEASVNIRAIKERMKNDRINLKRLKAVQDKYFTSRLFEKTDSAREAAWIAAYKTRSEALARGELPKIETCAQCTLRQQNQIVYTP